MEPITEEVAAKFCRLCDWTYETWVTHKFLFDENKTPEKDIGKAVSFTNRLSTITQEYCLQQIAKLHDPTKQGKNFNLSIDYMVQYGDWGERTDQIESIHSKLSDLWKHLKLVRSKILAHNDFETIIVDAALGSFPEGMDDEYFEVLQELVNEVHEKWSGTPFPFNDLAIVDVHDFLRLLQRA